MHILLIQSLTQFDESPIYPLGLCYIAAQLSGQDVSIFDMNTSQEPYGELYDKIRDIRPQMIGLSLRNIKVATPGGHHSSFVPHEETIKIIRKAAPDTLIVAGGSAFSLYAEDIMKRLPEIDFGVSREGEESFPELLKNLKQPEAVKGVYFRKKEEIHFTGHRGFIPSNKISSPNRSLVDAAKYLSSPYSIGVQSKRGCGLKCIHCSDRYLFGKKIRLRDPVEVVDEIEHLIKQDGLKDFSFVDQEFNIPMNHAEEICKEIIYRKLNVKWTAWFNVKYINQDLLEMVKKSGCARLSFSPDSASDSILKRLKKNFTARELIRTYVLASKIGMEVEYSFMVNGPGETIFTLFETLLFVVKAKYALRKKLLLHNLLMTTPIRIYPWTELRKIAVQEGLIDLDNDLVEPVFYNPAPLRHVVGIMSRCSRFVWWIKGCLKK